MSRIFMAGLMVLALLGGSVAVRADDDLAAARAKQVAAAQKLKGAGQRRS